MTNTEKNLILRKRINDVTYDLMVKTIADQVYVSDTETLTMALEALKNSVEAKADSTALSELEAKFNALMNDAPEAYNTLKEISDYISSHTSEYEALVALANDKVNKEEGKGLSSEDFTAALKQKLEDIYDKATLDEKFESIESRVSALEVGGGSGSGTIPENLTAANVKYTDGNGKEMTVKDALDDLLYVPVTVRVSTPIATTREKGESLTNVVINWTTNKDKLTAQSFNSVALDDLTVRTHTEAGPITGNKTFSVKVNDGKKEASGSVAFSFLNKVYYGVSENSEASAVDSAFVLGLTGQKFAGSKTAVGSITANAEAGQFIYYAQPASFADPVFNIGGFDTTFEKFATIDFTNASGYAESYNVFKSGQAGLGSTSMTVK